MDLGLFQREVADMLGVSKVSVYLWETQGSLPGIRLLPGIIEFLGYVPQAKPTGLPQQLHAYRMIRGLTQKEAARGNGVDESTWRAWEGELKRPGSKRTRSVLGYIVQSLDSTNWHPV